MPNYETLTMNDFKEWLEQDQEVAAHFPEGKEYWRLPRSYTINLIYSVKGDAFAEWVEERIKARDQKHIEKQDLAIQLAPEIAAAFAKATHSSRK